MPPSHRELPDYETRSKYKNTNDIIYIVVSNCIFSLLFYFMHRRILESIEKTYMCRSKGKTNIYLEQYKRIIFSLNVNQFIWHIRKYSTLI